MTHFLRKSIMTMVRRYRQRPHLGCRTLVIAASTLLSLLCSAKRTNFGLPRIRSPSTTSLIPNPATFAAFGAGAKPARQRKGVLHERCALFPEFKFKSWTASPSSRIRCDSPFAASKLHLFAATGKGGGNDDGGDQEDSDDGEAVDLPTWVSSLRRWPLLPTAPSQQELSAVRLDDDEEGVSATRRVVSPPGDEEDELADAVESARNRIAMPLASLLNVEALLAASAENASMENSTATRAEAMVKNVTTPLSILPRLEELGSWDQLVGTMQRSLSEIPTAYINSAVIGNTTDTILREATSRLEFLAGEASRISPNAVQDLIVRASKAIASKDAQGESAAAEDLVAVAEQMAREQGLDVIAASEQAREATKETANLVSLANGLLSAGFVVGDDEKKTTNPEAKPLFGDFATARSITRTNLKTAVAKAAEMASLSGAIYQEAIPRTLDLGHSIVANGTSDDIVWTVSDSIMYEDEFQELKSKRDRTPMLVRTITLRGFDASDENVDRELVLNRICTANPESLNGENGVLLHSGLLDIARSVYDDVKPYIDLTAPTHRLVLNGHSVGGSLSVLLLLLLTEERGVEFVRDKVLRVFTFGAPPIAVTSIPMSRRTDAWDDHLGPMFGRPTDSDLKNYTCDVLRAFDLPPSMVYGYIQPWDPIVRLFSEIDPLYPLIGDIGEDGVTPYASGPPRSLRSITRAIVESWDGWPRFRDMFKDTVDQNYTSVGVQHILLPEPIRYLTDRLVSVNVGVPPVDDIVRISAEELLPLLETKFPLDTFRISYIPAAIRAFVHHFYPAYGFPIVDFAFKKLEESSGVSKIINRMGKEEYERAMGDIEEKVMDVSDAEGGRGNGMNKERGGGLGWSVPWESRKED